MRVGIRADHVADLDVIATDLVGDVIQDAETTMVYGSWNHALTGKLRTSLLANYQWQRYDSVDLEDHVLFAGATISYDLTEFLALEGAYYFDRLESDIATGGLARSYNRNRVFVGIRANY